MRSKLFNTLCDMKQAGVMYGRAMLSVAFLTACLSSASAQETLNNQAEQDFQLDLSDPENPIQSEPLPEADAPDQVLEDVKIENKVAVFSGIEKITGRIITFDVYINETVQFGALQVTPRVCYTRPVTHKPKTTSFLEVDEITLDRQIRRIFTGWMFAASPALNAVEHPVYDIWLNDCKMESDLPPPS